MNSEKKYRNEGSRLNPDVKKQGFLSKALTQAKKMKAHDWKDLGLLAVSFVPGKIMKLRYPHIWTVSEYRDLARDNGYWYFKYVRDNYPDRMVYYPIAEDSPDYKKVTDLGNAIRFGSFKHFLLFWASEKQFMSSKSAGFPSRICEDLVDWHLTDFQYILLNHGITRGPSVVVDARRTSYDYICTCSEKDRSIIIKDNYQPENKVVVTGFARHDNLGSELLQKNLILVMPTWRSWLNYKNGTNAEEISYIEQQFLASPYYENYQKLLKSPDLISFLEQNNLQLIFYQHEYAQHYNKFFESGSPNIVIADHNSYDIQTLLKKAALLVTDYSSVCYDFAYMYKPVLYFQFDKEQFEYFHYSAGENYTYENDGVGELIYNENDLIARIKKYYSDGFAMPEVYAKRTDQYFRYHDKNNCRRIFEYYADR